MSICLCPRTQYRHKQYRQLPSMQQARTQLSFREPLRTFMFRMLGMCQQSPKFAGMHSLQQLDGAFSRLLAAEQIKQSLIYELVPVEPKSQQHCLLVLSLLIDLAKWLIEVAEAEHQGSVTGHLLETVPVGVVECVVGQSLIILKQDRKHQTLFLKQNQLARTLMLLIPTYLPHLLGRQAGTEQGHGGLVAQLVSNYGELLSMIKDHKQSHPPACKQEFKRNLHKGINEAIRAIIQAMRAHDTPKSYRQITKNSPLVAQVHRTLFKLLQISFDAITDDLYRILQLLNGLQLNCTGSVSASQVSAASTHNYPDVITLYGGNFSEMLISRLKILKTIVVAVGSCACLASAADPGEAGKSKSPLLSSSAGEAGKLRYSEKFLHTTAHLLIKINHVVRLSNYYILDIIYCLYELVMPLLLTKPTVVPMYLFTHLISKNLARLVDSSKNDMQAEQRSVSVPYLHLHSVGQPASGGGRACHLAVLETLLAQVAGLFGQRQLEYFLQYYDWNFMEEDVVLNTLKFMYEFIENPDHEGRHEADMFKKCLASVNRKIEVFLDLSCEGAEKGAAEEGIVCDGGTKEKQEQASRAAMKHRPKKQRKQFYQLKKKEYLSLVEKINEKPKELFKMLKQLQSNNQHELKQYNINKLVRILKKSKDIQNKSMIDFLAANSPESEQILEKYLQSFVTKTSSIALNTNFEHFLRYIISNFFLTGESQQIIRFLDKLTTYFYCHQNPSSNVFRNSDSVYTFANAIIILNTDQHNPKNENKMSLEAFVKMCRKINAGEDLHPDIIASTFKSIRESEIHTFRNRYSMEKISLESWLDMTSDYESVVLGYYDEQVAQIFGQDEGGSGFKDYANELLLSLIDEKETQKLELMVERFEYDDRKFDCEIVEKIRVMASTKKHIPMHVLQKIFEEAHFTDQKCRVDEKMLSYCWLGAGVIENFSDSIPYSKIVDFVLKTWRIGFELKDHLQIRQGIEVKNIKKMIREYKKKQGKKSFMDIFSNFLSAKNSESEAEQHQADSGSKENGANSSQMKKKISVINSRFKIYQLLLNRMDSRTRAAQSVLISLRQEQSRRFEQFTFYVYLIFHLIQGHQHATSSEPLSPIKIRQSSLAEISYQCIEILLNFLNDFFGLSDSRPIGSRIASLKVKSLEKYELVYQYTQFWAMKILLCFSFANACAQERQKLFQKQEVIPKVQEIYRKCQGWIAQSNPEMLGQLLSVIDKQGVTEASLEEVGLTKQLIKQLNSAIASFSLQLNFCNLANASQEPPPSSQPKIEQPQVNQQTKSEPDLHSSDPQSQADQVPGVVGQPSHIVSSPDPQLPASLVQQQNTEDEEIEQSLRRQLGLSEELKPIHTDNQMDQQPITEGQGEQSSQMEPEKQQAQQASGQKGQEAEQTGSDATVEPVQPSLDGLNHPVGENSEQLGFPVYML